MPTRLERILSIRAVILLVVVLPILAVATVLVWISSVTNRQISENLAGEIVQGTTARVTDEVTRYLSDAMQVSDRYARRVEHGRLPVRDNLQWWEQMMMDDLLTSPTIASICFGNIEGDATYFQRAHRRLELGRATGGNENGALEYEIDPTTRQFRYPPLRVYTYEPRKRPWYTAAMATPDAPMWTPIYFWFGDKGHDSETGTGYARVLKSPGTGEPAGVLVVDVTLHALSRFLRSMPVAQSGSVFIADDKGLLVALSAQDGNVTSTDGIRLPLHQADDPAIRAVASLVAGSETRSARATRMQIDGAPAHVQVTPLTPFPGIDWKLAIVLPESSFLDDAQRAQSRSVLLAMSAGCAGVVLGILMARRLSQPLVELTGHISRIGSGDLDSRLELRGTRELARLSDQLNQMASGLKDRMELQQSMELAKHVQQSLLPSATPSNTATAHGSMDIHGRSAYCDHTGGDYFDFIEFDHPLGKRTLIAVGDVTGHGIGAALLMATARGALRASVGNGARLNDVLARVNRVLAGGESHGLFMTLSLLVIDPAQGTARWASAGHDPALVYELGSDRFYELTGNDLPLGIEIDSTYHEHDACNIQPDSIIVVGTDGIWEALAASGNERFGKQRLRDVIRQRATMSAREIGDGIEAALNEYCGEGRLKDDVTYVVIRLQAASLPTSHPRECQLPITRSAT